MGGCASKPKESDIPETSPVTENVVVESKNVEPETVSQEKADEVVAEKKEESTAVKPAEGEPAKPAEAEPAKTAEAEPAKPAEAEPASEAVKTETGPPKQEEAAAGNETKTNEEPLVTL